MGSERGGNEQCLVALDGRTGGHSVYAANPKELQKFLERQFANLNRVFAESVTLTLEPVAGVTLRYGIRISPTVADIPLQDEMALGAITVDRGLKVLLEFLVDPIPEHATEVRLGQATFQMVIPGRPVPYYRFKMDLGRPVVDELREEEPPREILSAMSRLVLYRLQAEARKDVQQGGFGRATRRLRNLATHLLSQGETDLAKTVLLEVNRLEQGKDLSEDGKKEIKYGTRALLLPPGPDLSS